jgi:hypothetical protein
VRKFGGFGMYLEYKKDNKKGSSLLFFLRPPKRTKIDFLNIESAMPF